MTYFKLSDPTALRLSGAIKTTLALVSLASGMLLTSGCGRTTPQESSETLARVNSSSQVPQGQFYTCEKATSSPCYYGNKEYCNRAREGGGDKSKKYTECTKK